MKENEIFDKFITSHGMRKTAPRDLIVNCFLETEEHVSTEQLYNIVHQKDSSIGYATIARTLKLLSQAGLCRVVDFGDGILRYEHKYKHQHHDHLICTECGKLVEVYDEKLEKIQEDLVKKYGFMQKSHNLNIYGICPDCQKTNT